MTTTTAIELGNGSRVDLHHHFVPTCYAEALKSTGGDPSGWSIPAWTIDNDFQFCQKAGIKTAILSLTAPGACVLKDANEAASLARQVNVEAASYKARYPAKYGFFAALPSLLDVELALAEIDFALDTLQADGVTLFTRYGNDNHYLGHCDFKPIWKHLNRRRTVVFVHPTHAVDTNLVNPWLPQPMIDYPHETTRTTVDLIMSGTVRDYKDCKIILSHAGGTLPYLAERPASMLPHTPFGKGISEHSFLEDAKTFYFDLALSTSAVHLAALKEFAAPGHVVFGSDYPYAPEASIHSMNSRLEQNLGTDPLLDQYNRLNAMLLLPRLARDRSESDSETSVDQ